MTSFVGKWKLLVLVFVGCYAFAKAELPPHSAHTIFSSTEIATFSIDKSTTRTEIFDLFKELFLNHSIKAKLNGYKRHGGVIILLDLTLTDSTGADFPLKLENKTGINPACLTINAAQNNIEEFASCEAAVKAIEPVEAGEINKIEVSESVSQVSEVSLREVEKEVITSRKENTNSQIETARLRVQQQQEERRLDILERKAKLESQQEQNRIKNAALAEERALKRQQQLDEVRDRQLERRQATEAARIEKLEEEKRQIAIETARIEAQAQAERERLKVLEKERLAAQQREEERRLEEENAKKQALLLKEQEKERLRQVEIVRKRLEKERMEAARAEKDRVKKEKEALEQKRLEQEIELEKLAQRRIAAQQALDQQLEEERELMNQKKEAERLRQEAALIDERERYRGAYSDKLLKRKEKMLNANNEDFVPSDEVLLEQGYLIFNAEQCSYRVFPGRTIIYNAFGNQIIIIEEELLDAPQSGKVIINRIEATYEYTSNLLIIKNSEGEMIDEKGKVIGAGINNIVEKETSFVETAKFEITAQTSNKELDTILAQLAEYKFDSELLELERHENGLIHNMTMRIGEATYLFQEKERIAPVIIKVNEPLHLIKIDYP